MPALKVLCVDDEIAIRSTTASILRMHGFDPTPVGTVAEALAEIASHPFDVLISDLNIGEQGDGFTVVSAMRRTHPQCINFIVTGYPAIEAALRAISNQVDEVLMKPTNPPHMVAAIEQRLRERTPAGSIQTKRLWDLIDEKKDEICQKVIREMRDNSELAELPLSDEERLDHLRIMLGELVQELKTLPTGVPPHSLPAAAKTGKERHLQEYPIAFLAVDARLIQGVIYQIVHENLLAITLSHLMPDLRRLNEILSLQAEEIVRKFVQAEKSAA